MNKIKFTLRQYPLNAQGYDSMGAYYGVGLLLYWYGAEDAIDMGYGPRSYPDGFVRAKNRKDAKLKVQQLFPNIQATFYR